MSGEPGTLENPRDLPLARGDYFRCSYLCAVITGAVCADRQRNASMRGPCSECEQGARVIERIGASPAKARRAISVDELHGVQWHGVTVPR